MIEVWCLTHPIDLQNQAVVRLAKLIPDLQTAENYLTKRKKSQWYGKCGREDAQQQIWVLAIADVECAIG